MFAVTEVERLYSSESQRCTMPMSEADRYVMPEYTAPLMDVRDMAIPVLEMTHSYVMSSSKDASDAYCAEVVDMVKLAEIAHISSAFGYDLLVSRLDLAVAVGAVAVGIIRHSVIDIYIGQGALELDVWAKERELAGLKASVSTLTSEVQRLQKMCEERRAAEEALRKKWKRIEEFDGRRTELESIYSELIHLNLVAASAWEQHTQRAREYSATTVIPLCHHVQQKAGDAHDLLEKEVAIFHRVPDNRVYMLPSTPQALLDSMGAGGAFGPESLVAAERQADLLTAKAGARDPSAIPSICRINAATQHISGYDGQDVGLYAVVEALRFVFSPCASPACLLEELAKAMRQIQTSRNLVNNGRLLLSVANGSRHEHERNASACSSMASEQEKVAMEEWLPELKVAVQEAQKCLEDCKRVRGMVDEWWEQPASTAVDWITVDGQNVATWLAHVKQLQTAFYDKQLL
ncbi:hypothetical protein L7F22_020479 [Adiantum nelumboides]|nr:hypothetical protein [Adiantum nelumboides]